MGNGVKNDSDDVKGRYTLSLDGPLVGASGSSLPPSPIVPRFRLSKPGYAGPRRVVTGKTTMHTFRVISYKFLVIILIISMAKMEDYACYKLYVNIVVIIIDINIINDICSVYKVSVEATWSLPIP